MAERTLRSRYSRGSKLCIVWTKLLGTGALATACPSVAMADSDQGTRLTTPLTGTVLYNGGQTGPGSSYSRMIRLQRAGAANPQPLLATFENFDAQAFQIYQSNDDGLTWTGPISTVYEQHLGPGWAFKWQPDLFELQQSAGNLGAGTLLLAGTSVGPGGFEIELYISTDQGRSWRYRSTVASSVGAPKGGIFEPNIQVAADGTLMIYYSDETMAQSQAIVQKQSTDGGLTWGPRQNVVAVNDLSQRPGMPVTTRLPDGRYVMSFEAVGLGSEAHIKYSNDGKNWGDTTSYGTAIRTPSGSFIGATPYIRWTPIGSGNGALFVSGQFLRNSPNADRELMMSTDLGRTWTMVPSPVQWQGATDNPGNGFDKWDHAGWSQAILPTADGTGIIHMASSYRGNGINALLYAREKIILPGRVYTLTNQNSGKAVDVPMGASTLSLGLQQYEVNNNPAQNWVFRDMGDNRYTIYNPQNNLAWDNPQGRSVEGAPIQQYTQNNLTAQQWQLVPVGNGSWKFKNVASGFVAAVDRQRQDNLAPITQWRDNGTPDHNWFPLQR